MAARWFERHQIALYLGALALGAMCGLLAPEVSGSAEWAIHPLLALLLYSTFLGLPIGGLGRALREGRFLSAILVVNFVLAPLLAWALSRFLVHDRALLVGALFVLLTPCIDYVIVFAGLAGGDARRLLATAPLLLIVQMLLLPVYLRWFAGAEFADAVFGDAAAFVPFVEAFALIIALPFAAAALTRFAAARFRIAAAWQAVWEGAMVPLMIAVLAVVVASQIAGVGAEIRALSAVLPVYALFAALMVPVGSVVGRVVGLGAPERRAVAFSGATRNSLVVLPLVLVLPVGFELAPLAVVAQTLVELVAMVVLVRLVPRIIRDPEASRSAPSRARARRSAAPPRVPAARAAPRPRRRRSRRYR